MDKKKLAFFVNADDEGGMYSGNVEETQTFLASYLYELEDRDVLTIQIVRRDMTDEEIEALPEE